MQMCSQSQSPGSLDDTLITEIESTSIDLLPLFNEPSARFQIDPQNQNDHY